MRVYAKSVNASVWKQSDPSENMAIVLLVDRNNENDGICLQSRLSVEMVFTAMCGSSGVLVGSPERKSIFIY